MRTPPSSPVSIRRRPRLKGSSCISSLTHGACTSSSRRAVAPSTSDKHSPHFVSHSRSDVKKFESTLARIRCFDYGADWHNANTTMLMTGIARRIFGAAAPAASLPCASALVGGERGTDDATALTERYGIDRMPKESPDSGSAERVAFVVLHRNP